MKPKLSGRLVEKRRGLRGNLGGSEAPEGCGGVVVGPAIPSGDITSVHIVGIEGCQECRSRHVL